MAMTTITVTVSEKRKPIRTQLDVLAEKLGCRLSDLVWHALIIMLKNPPKTAPEGSSKVLGKAAGFWVIHTRIKDRVVKVSIQEVISRAKGKGHSFFRYTKDDVKSRTRARKQAVRAADYDADLASIKEKVKLTELPKSK